MMGWPATDRWGTIMADPPWPERGGGKCKRGADKHYPLMPVEEIAALPVQDLWSPRGGHLYLWTTNNHLEQAFEVVRAWGCRYVTVITWVKSGGPGLGQYFRGKSEHCLFAVTRHATPPYRMRQNGTRAQGTTIIWAPRLEHSRKPDAIYSIAEEVSPGPRLELFARRRVSGWSAWGNECGEVVE